MQDTWSAKGLERLGVSSSSCEFWLPRGRQWKWGNRKFWSSRRGAEDEVVLWMLEIDDQCGGPSIVSPSGRMKGTANGPADKQHNHPSLWRICSDSVFCQVEHPIKVMQGSILEPGPHFCSKKHVIAIYFVTTYLL